MMDAVIHIGFGKTGTSSLQAFLSRGGLADSHYEYCAIDPKGNVVVGDELYGSAARSPLGFVSSTPYFARIDHQQVKVGLAGIRDRGKIPILSHEYWSAVGDTFITDSILERWGIDNPYVIAFVRPQVEYMNSGWWQWWWRWEGEFDKPADVIAKEGTKRILWAKQLEPWSQLARKLSVRLYGVDTLDDFVGLLGLERKISETPRTNAGISLELIQLYNAFPGLRTQLGPEEDSFLSSLMNRSKTPWIIPRDLAAEILERCKEDNLALLNLLSRDQQSQMRDNVRWWSADAYPEVDQVLSMPPRELTHVFTKVLAARLAAQEEAADLRNAFIVAEQDLSNLRVQLKGERDASVAALMRTETLQEHKKAQRREGILERPEETAEFWNEFDKDDLANRCAVLHRQRREAAEAKGEDEVSVVRRTIGQLFIRGRGVEVGAGSRPFPLPAGAICHYGDILNHEQLVDYFRTDTVKKSDYNINAQTFDGIAMDSLDFVISAHVIEHLENPVRAIKEALLRLRPGGVFVLIVPELTQTFDRRRQSPPLSHVLADEIDGGEGTRLESHLDHYRYVHPVLTGETLDEDEINRLAQIRFERGDDRHVHAWTELAFFEIVDHVAKFIPLKVEARISAVNENLYVLRRT